MQWPDQVIRAYSEYLSKEPSPEEKLEYMLAYGVSVYCNANREKGKPAKPITDFMLFRGAWKSAEAVESEEPETDLGKIAMLMGATIKRR